MLIRKARRVAVLRVDGNKSFRLRCSASAAASLVFAMMGWFFAEPLVRASMRSIYTASRLRFTRRGAFVSPPRSETKAGGR